MEKRERSIMTIQDYHLVHLFLAAAILSFSMDRTYADMFSTLDLSKHYPRPISSTSSSSTHTSGTNIQEQLSINVTSQLGTHAYLPCKVQQLGNKPVSWIRVRDGHILTVDRAVFIADQRFVVLNQPNKFWTLQIKYVQARDAGAYECQVSTEPKVSAKVYLDVVVPRTEISGEPDRYVKAGSIVVLRCIIRGALEPPTFIMWYHGSEQLVGDSNRHRMQIDRNFPEVEGSLSTMGSLIIEVTKKRDSGNYTCSPSNSPSATVTLNVINGEHAASAIMSSASALNRNAIYIVLMLSFLALPKS